MQHLLVPYDFKDTAHGALDVAFGLAKKLGARITLLYVAHTETVTEAFFGLNAVRYLSSTLERDEDDAPAPALAFDALIATAQGKLEDVVALEWKDSVDVDAKVVDGRAADVIVDYAREHDVDMIVMGTHGRGAVGHLFLGSVAENVVRTALCPVLTVRRTKE